MYQHQRCNKWPRSPPPPRRGLGSVNPRGRGIPAGIPEYSPTSGKSGCPDFFQMFSLPGAPIKFPVTFIIVQPTYMHISNYFTRIVVSHVHAISICQVPLRTIKSGSCSFTSPSNKKSNEQRALFVAPIILQLTANNWFLRGMVVLAPQYIHPFLIFGFLLLECLRTSNSVYPLSFFNFLFLEWLN